MTLEILWVRTEPLCLCELRAAEPARLWQFGMLTEEESACFYDRMQARVFQSQARHLSRIVLSLANITGLFDCWIQFQVGFVMRSPHRVLNTPPAKPAAGVVVKWAQSVGVVRAGAPR